MNDLDIKQKKTPFFSALENYRKSDAVPFDVPGHKLGIIDKDVLRTDFKYIYSYDANAPRGLDNLNHPVGVIKEAEDLAALAFKADHAYFLVNGCTSAIQVMMMSVLKENDYVLIPRNAHKSVISSLIISGATPIFMESEIDYTYGISKSVTFDTVKKYIENNPFVKAVLIIYPTYFGDVCDLKKICDYAHSKGKIVLVDEAHGTHFAFCEKLPFSAIECGADIVASSMHKTGLSLTQSSLLLVKGDRIDSSKIRTSINILQSTSPSSLLIASMDVARKELYFNCNRLMKNVLNEANEFRKRCKSLKNIIVLDREYFMNNNLYDYDESKLIISFKNLNISGFKAYNLLKDKYNIQAELGEQLVVLFVLTSGTKKEHLDKLYEALIDIDNKYKKEEILLPNYIYHFPKPILKPRDAFNHDKEDILIKDSIGHVCAEQIMIYPPGIPLIIPGEQIDEEIVGTITTYLNNGCLLFKDSSDEYIRVLKKGE